MCAVDGAGGATYRGRMTHVNFQAAQANLAELLDLVERGEKVAIVRDDKNPVRLVADPQPRRNYRAIVGCWQGRVDVSRADEADKAIYRKLGMLG
jgi:antitoxin (DNA-binding transcriptional repressor) of toxin-antitoxin stability system